MKSTLPWSLRLSLLALAGVVVLVIAGPWFSPYACDEIDFAGHWSAAPTLLDAHWFGTDSLGRDRSEEHTSELQSLMRISYAVFCLKKKKNDAILSTQGAKTDDNRIEHD